jgi:ribosome biogenesis GTPase A
MLIMGIPHVGKSSLINGLLNRMAAKVGDEPAVTKNQQRFELDPTMNITDTPGMMWPKIEYDSDGFMLAASHAIGRNAVIDEDVAIFLANNLLHSYPDLLNTRYKLDKMKLNVAEMDGVDLLEAIAKRRAYKRRDGILDLERTAMVFLTDYRHGTLGRISLETPDSRKGMIAKHVVDGSPIEDDQKDSTNS